MANPLPNQIYIGLMSGTSLDGVDAVLVELVKNDCKLLGHHFSPYADALRADVLALQNPQHNELEQSQVVSQQLSLLYADSVNKLIAKTPYSSKDVIAIGCHGQTVRHRPELGFTLQLSNAALLAENTGINVVHDFRSRDIAVGGQGAPLVPAFHQALFAHPQNNRAIINIGGIANITYLPSANAVIGFDSGTGNILMDAWIMENLGKPYDANGDWAASGEVNQPLLKALLAEPFFKQHPPKSTGRDLFNLDWLKRHLSAFETLNPEDVQRTLLELTAVTITDAVHHYCKDTDEVFICGGGAFNRTLVVRLEQLLKYMPVKLTSELGLDPQLVEATAFAWLAKQTIQRKTSNIISVTGAKFARILGSVTYY